MTLKIRAVEVELDFDIHVSIRLKIHHHHIQHNITYFQFSFCHPHAQETPAMTKRQCMLTLIIVANLSLCTISFHFGVNNALAITKVQGQLRVACPISPRLKTSRSATSIQTASAVDSSTKSDKRPHTQCVKAPRKARRMNQSFMHLYRKFFSIEQIPISSTHLTKE